MKTMSLHGSEARTRGYDQDTVKQCTEALSFEDTNRHEEES